MTYKKGFFRPFPRDKLKGFYRIRIVDCGRVTEFVATSRLEYVNPIKKLDSERYEVLATGEIKKFSKCSVTRAENVGHVVRTVNNLRRLINSNELTAVSFWVTLTYAKNMTDTKQLYCDFDYFRRKFYKWASANGYSKPEYICCVEPQGRGAWHIHGLFMWYDSNAPKFISNKTLAEMWGHGFVNIQRPSKVRNLGAYISTYLTCTRGKKNKRLFMYPAGINIYRCSRGVVKPVDEVEIWQDFQFGDESDNCMYSEVRTYLDENLNEVNTVYKWTCLQDNKNVLFV